MQDALDETERESGRREAVTAQRRHRPAQDRQHDEDPREPRRAGQSPARRRMPGGAEQQACEGPEQTRPGPPQPVPGSAHGHKVARPGRARDAASRLPRDVSRTRTVSFAHDQRSCTARPVPTPARPRPSEVPHHNDQRDKQVGSPAPSHPRRPGGTAAPPEGSYESGVRFPADGRNRGHREHRAGPRAPRRLSGRACVSLGRAGLLRP